MTTRAWHWSSTVVAVLGFAMLGVNFAPAASAAIVNCPPLSSGVCQNLRPIAECYWPNSNGTVSVVWGWNNPRSDTAQVAIGTYNGISPSPQDQGQPTLFAPGRHHNAFVTTTQRSRDEVEWRLAARRETVNFDDLEDDDDDDDDDSDDSDDSDDDGDGDDGLARCETKPVPQVGDVGALLLGGLVLAVGALAVVAARPRRRAAVVAR